ncbi:hypothetical protein Tco_1101695 [Tanacetum coccineum]
MVSFKKLHITPKASLQDKLKRKTRIESDFKHAIATLFGQDSGQQWIKVVRGKSSGASLVKHRKALGKNPKSRIKAADLGNDAYADDLADNRTHYDVEPNGLRKVDQNVENVLTQSFAMLKFTDIQDSLNSQSSLESEKYSSQKDCCPIFQKIFKNGRHLFISLTNMKGHQTIDVCAAGTSTLRQFRTRNSRTTAMNVKLQSWVPKVVPLADMDRPTSSTRVGITIPPSHNNAEVNM